MIDLGLLRLELFLGGLIGLVLVVDLFTKNRNIVHSLAVAGSAAALIASLVFTRAGVTFSGAFVADGLSVFFKVLLLLNVFLVVLLSRRFLEKNPRYAGEYYLLLFSATLGMLLLASSRELITFYVALELLSISSYVISAYQKTNPRSTEAGLKYLLLGAMASGVLLFGMSLVYGVTGSTYFASIGQAAAAGTPGPLLSIGLVLILAGMSFKIAVVPFHMWVPDVYEGAPTPVVAFFSTGTKIAGFAVIVRLFFEAFGGLAADWGMLMVAVSAVTILLGNLAALPQTNIKRLMGYSSIAQAGYILIGVAMASFTGLVSTLFYLAAYLFSNLLAFGVIIVFGNHTGADAIDDYKGLSRRSPFLALSLLLALMSLGGVPPLVGFFGKLYLFVAAVEKGYLWLVAIGVLMSVVSVYYYLMVLKRVYIEAPQDTSPIRLSAGEKLALAVSMAGTVALGFFPYPLFKSILSSARLFLQ